MLKKKDLKVGRKIFEQMTPGFETEMMLLVLLSMPKNIGDNFACGMGE